MYQPRLLGTLTRMGIFGDRRPEQIAKAASDARNAGARVFVPQLEWPSAVASNAFSVDDWGRTIQLVEAEGWALTHWQVLQEGKAPKAYPLFRLLQ